MEINKRMERFWENFSQKRVKEIQNNTTSDSYALDWTASEASVKLDGVLGKSFLIKEENGIELNYEFLTSSKILWSEGKENVNHFIKLIQFQDIMKLYLFIILEMEYFL